MTNTEMKQYINYLESAKQTELLLGNKRAAKETQMLIDRQYKDLNNRHSHHYTDDEIKGMTKQELINLGFPKYIYQ